MRGGMSGAVAFRRCEKKNREPGAIRGFAFLLFEARPCVVFALSCLVC